LFEGVEQRMKCEEYNDLIHKLCTISQKYEYSPDGALNAVLVMQKDNEGMHDNKMFFTIICSCTIAHGVLQRKFDFLYEIYGLLVECGLLHEIESANNFKVYYSENGEEKKQKTFMSLERYIEFLQELDSIGVEYSIC
jgi:hypothetical protein